MDKIRFTVGKVRCENRTRIHLNKGPQFSDINYLISRRSYLFASSFLQFEYNNCFIQRAPRCNSHTGISGIQMFSLDPFDLVSLQTRLQNSQFASHHDFSNFFLITLNGDSLDINF